MRYIDGGTLRELMASGPIPLAQGLRLVGEVAEALAYAHNHDDPKTGHVEPIIHRDVKPANILIDRNGTALLTDFGKETLKDRYLLPGESFQDLFVRVASMTTLARACAGKVNRRNPQ